MRDLPSIYRMPLGLLTDLYQLTMAYGYWKLGRAEQQAVFHLFFRKPPFQGGYALTAGFWRQRSTLSRRFESTPRTPNTCSHSRVTMASRCLSQNS